MASKDSVTENECPGQTALMPMLMWAFLVYINNKDLFSSVIAEILHMNCENAMPSEGVQADLCSVDHTLEDVL